MYISLSILALLYVCLFLLAIQKVRGSGDKFGFIYFWGPLVGAFVWEDVLIFAPAFLVMTLITLFTRDLRIGLLLFLIFWIVRSSGETLYFFLEQFFEPTHEPHDIRRHVQIIQKMLGGICLQKTYIIMQVLFQVLDIAAISATVLLLTHWQYVPIWG